MAHDKIYGICGDKCAVNITNLIVRARIEFEIGVLAANDVCVKTFMLQSYGITNNKDVTAIISPLQTIVNSTGAAMIEISHYFADSGVLIVIVKNRVATAMTGLKFNVAVI